MKFSKESLEKLVQFIDGDGWTIYERESFDEMGFEKSFVDKFAKVHESDFRSPKSMIFIKGGVAHALMGVYGLDFLAGVVRELGLPTSERFGRGWVAREYCEKIAKHAEGM